MLFLILDLCLFRLIFFCFVLVLRLGLGWSRLVLGLFCIGFLGQFLLVCLSFFVFSFSLFSLTAQKSNLLIFFASPLRKCNSLAFVTFSKTVPTELQKLVNYFFELLYLLVFLYFLFFIFYYYITFFVFFLCFVYFFLFWLKYS